MGIVEDILDGTSKEMSPSDGITVVGLKRELETTYRGLKKLRPCLSVVNDEYANDSVMIHHQDEIAIVPPVGG